MIKKEIKNGATYQDKWGRIWFVVNYDNAINKWQNIEKVDKKYML